MNYLQPRKEKNKVSTCNTATAIFVHTLLEKAEKDKLGRRCGWIYKIQTMISGGMRGEKRKKKRDQPFS